MRHPLARPEDLAALAADADAVVARGRYAPSTHHQVDLVLDRFAAWCSDRRLSALPAAPATVGSYLAWLATPEIANGEVLRDASSLATIRATKTAIGIAHSREGLASPSSDPWLCMVMGGIARSPWLRHSQQMTPLGAAQMRTMMSLPAPLPTLPALRDRALLLVAADTGWPIGDVIALPRNRVHCDAGGVHLTAPSGKVIKLANDPADALVALLEALPARVALTFGVRGFDHSPQFVIGSGRPEVTTLAATIRQAFQKSAGLQVRMRQPLPPLTAAQLARLLLSRDRRRVRWLRDRAMLLTGWHLALRGSEVGTITLDDLRRDDVGYTAWLSRTKNDQLATGTPLSLRPTQDPLLDPVQALDAWTAYRSPAGPGALFCRLDGARCRPERGVTAGDDVLDIVKAWTAAAGLEGRYGAHSLRIGFVVTAIRAGATIAEIMTVTRQRSPEMVGHYGRGAEAARRRAPRVLLTRSREEAA